MEENELVVITWFLISYLEGRDAEGSDINHSRQYLRKIHSY